MVKTLGQSPGHRTNFDDGSASSPSRFWQILIAIFAITIAWHHVLLTSRANAKTNGQNLNLGVGVDLEILDTQIGKSKKLTASQKEELISTIRQLQSARLREQQKQALAASLAKAHQEVGKGEASPYAYMFVIGGINEKERNYKGFLYDVLVAAHLLKELGSTADIVLFIEFAPESEADNKLPPEELQYLEALQIQLHILPKPTKATFASLVFEKFRALQLTQYRRVIFMDADAIPLANMDYLFHLSDPLHTSTPTILQPNLILASRGEPCNAGVFMVEPAPTAWDELQGIIHRQQEEGDKLPYPHFSWERGWGYDFEKEGDKWLSNAKYGVRWRFHAGHSDQGLLYYWTKFHVRKVSIVIQDKIENWIDPPDHSTANRTVDGLVKPQYLNTLTMEPLLQYSNPDGPLAYQFSCDLPSVQAQLKAHRPHQCLVPYRDFAHFMGDSKPWMAFSPARRMRDDVNTYLYNAATKVWFEKLSLLNDQLGMGLDFDNWYEKHHAKEAPLGSMAMYNDLKDAHKKRRR